MNYYEGLVAGAVEDIRLVGNPAEIIDPFKLKDHGWAADDANVA